MNTNIDFRLSKEAAVEEEETYVEAQKTEPVPPTDIVAYNELRSCADLYRLYASDVLEIQPDFQRDVVWKLEEQSRFIDSLVKRLPIPSMCFSFDFQTQKWKVIDGLQRMSSIINFLGKDRWSLKNLEDIHPSLRGASNIQLRDGEQAQQRIYSTVLDMSIPITVIRCDYTKDSHMQYLFTIFHRLNSGGVRLNNQEIRNCVYSGPFNDMLKEFDAKDPNWNQIKKRIWGKIDRFRTIEVLLRMLAFDDRFEKYNGNLADFLNKFMHEKMKLPDSEAQALKSRLQQVSKLGKDALSPYNSKISLTLIEALMVGLLRNLSTQASRSAIDLNTSFAKMIHDPLFSEAARYAIASEGNVKTRLSAAASAFSVI
jgi:uncharacterized protein with ParB-like and HNH nuclease domain